MGKTIILNNSQFSSMKNILTENKESKNLSKARNYIRQTNPSADPQQIVDGIRTDMPNSRIADCKFMVGIVRMFLSNQLSDQKTINAFNKTLKLIGSNAHVNEYDNNLNNENATTLIERFSGSVKQELESDKTDVANQTYQANTNYTIVPINSFDEACEYGSYTDWCVTHYEDMFQSYTHGGLGRFYFCLRNDYQQIQKVVGENCPLDDYGLSMIAVSVDEDGASNTITCRWNHDNGGNDNIMTPKELSNVIGRNFYEAFPPYTEEEIEERKQQMAEMFQDYVADYIAYNGWDDNIAVESSNIMPTDVDDYDGYDDYVAENIHIVNSGNCRYDDTLSELVGDNRVMVFNEDGEAIVDTVFDDATMLNSQCETIEDVTIKVLVKKNVNLLNGVGEMFFEPTEQWPINIVKFSDTIYQCVFQNDQFKSPMMLINNKTRQRSTPYQSCMYVDHYNGVGFFSIAIGEPYKYMNIFTNEVYIDNIVDVKKISDMLIIKFADNQQYLYHQTDSQLKRVSNIPMKGGEGFYGRKFYRILGTDGNSYYVDYENGITYDTNQNIVDNVNQ